MLLLWVGSALAVEPPSVEEPLKGDRSWRNAAVVIGVEDYEELPDVPYAFFDALLFRDFAERTEGVQRRQLFYKANPGDEEMRSAMARGVARARSGGTLWIYFAGQGVITADGQPRLLAADASPQDAETALSLAELEAMAGRSRADKVIIVLDASFDGTGRDELAPPPAGAPMTFVGENNDKVVIWSADEHGAARLYEPSGHGLFTYLAMGALQGWGDSDGDGQVTLGEAQLYCRRAAAALGRPQVPSMDSRAWTGDWVVADGNLRLGPEAELFVQLSLEDRDRRLQAAVSALESESAAALRAARTKGPEAVAEVVRTYEGARVQVSWVPPLPAVAEARALLADPEALKPAKPETPPVAEGAEPAVAEVEPTEPEGPQLSGDDCDDLIGMEPDALMGNFSPGRIQCIEARIAKTDKQTDKDKLSRLLLANAQSKGDLDEWERLMRRHLDEISRADPDMCMLLAIHLQKKGVAYGEEVIIWADAALTNKHLWEGETYKKRLYTLYRLRAEAAGELWRDAEQNLIADPSRENDAITQKWRGKAKDYAREWLDYAEASGQDADRALVLCVSAAGTNAACQSG